MLGRCAVALPLWPSWRSSSWAVCSGTKVRTHHLTAYCTSGTTPPTPHRDSTYLNAAQQADTAWHAFNSSPDPTQRRWIHRFYQGSDGNFLEAEIAPMSRTVMNQSVTRSAGIRSATSRWYQCSTATRSNGTYLLSRSTCTSPSADRSVARGPSPPSVLSKSDARKTIVM